MTPRPIRRLLIANRGEIAVRIMRTCHERGIETVAVFSEADRASLHVRMADYAYGIGPAPSIRSYLVQEKLLEVAERAEVDAVHPGYGFLAENADFAESCAQAGLLFVGPPSGAIRLMGDKTAARREMQSAGVPMAPGSTGAVDDLDEVRHLAREIGFPVLIKAAAGGGGKGMRIVGEEADLERSFRAATSEAGSAFGDGRVYVEKYLEGPRHIEFQILADVQGHVVHLFERECSIQRRHQKVIEEAPSSLLSEELRAEMGASAVRAARACGYVNAGTVEFLVDSGGAYYFLEMNTRLQVEHPVTEWITGMDLVAEQLRIAEGEPLGYDQRDLRFSGHAIECRIYAEDPASGFLPAPGPVLRHRPPAGPGVRVDAGIDEGATIPVYYDPMISKLSTWGPTRADAIARMRRALLEYEIAGVPTTVPFCSFVMDHPAFRSGAFDTHFVASHYVPPELFPAGPERDAAALVASWHTHHASASDDRAGGGRPDADKPKGAADSKWSRRRLP